MKTITQAQIDLAKSQYHGAIKKLPPEHPLHRWGCQQMLGNPGYSGSCQRGQKVPVAEFPGGIRALQG